MANAQLIQNEINRIEAEIQSVNDDHHPNLDAMMTEVKELKNQLDNIE